LDICTLWSAGERSVFAQPVVSSEEPVRGFARLSIEFGNAAPVRDRIGVMQLNSVHLHNLAGEQTAQTSGIVRVAASTPHASASSSIM
jgi:hypothetical protein